MGHDEDALSYGQYLKAIRLEKGIRLEEVSAETRIGMDLLSRIEEEDDDALPADVFVKGFLRAYADAIGADREEAVRRFSAVRKSVQEPVAAQRLYLEPKRRRWPRLVAILIFLTLIAVIALYLTGGEDRTVMEEGAPTPEATTPSKTPPALKPSAPAAGSETPPPAEEISSTQDADTRPESQPEPQPPAVATEPEAAPPAAETPSPGDSGKLVLSVAAVEETWMKVIVDGGKPKEYTLASGDRLDLEGRVNFNLLIGNAGGVRLIYNGQELEVPGKSGQVVTLQLP